MGFFEKFSFDRFLASLQYMWQGMLCIFVVIGVIILSVYAIGAISSRVEESKKAKEEQEEQQ